MYFEGLFKKGIMYYQVGDFVDGHGKKLKFSPIGQEEEDRGGIG